MTEPFSLERLKSEWPKLLELEEAAFQRNCELDSHGEHVSQEKKDAVREWWRLVNGILWMFVRTRAQHNHELQPFPAYTLGRLANIAEEISNGNVPSLISDARKGGRALWRAERHHIAYGIAYIEAVREGKIIDKSPNKTVRQAYNVTAKAVQNWMKRRDEFCVGVPFKHLTPSQLQEKMVECAEVYARIGRGAPSDN